MICDELSAHILQLHETEKLSIRQIASHLGLNRRTVSRAIRAEGGDTRFVPKIIVTPYRRLIESWYSEHPKLLASQVFERLRGLGFAGSYETVKRATKTLRTKKPVMFHERVLLPGEEAQVDWMVLTLPFGTVYGFIY